MEDFKDSIRGLDMGVLVSNAGLSSPYARSGLLRIRRLASMGAHGGPRSSASVSPPSSSPGSRTSRSPPGRREHRGMCTADCRLRSDLPPSH